MNYQRRKPGQSPPLYSLWENILHEIGVAETTQEILRTTKNSYILATAVIAPKPAKQKRCSVQLNVTNPTGFTGNRWPNWKMVTRAAAFCLHNF